jgi:hypothetical protein
MQVAAHPERDEIETEIASMKREIATLRRSQASPASPGLPAVMEPKVETSPPQPKSVDALRTEAKARRAEAMQGLERRFYGDSPDPSWSGSLSRSINEGLDQGMLHDLTVRALDCRSEMCRIEVGQAKGASQSPVSQLVQLAEFENNQIYFDRRAVDDGSTATTLYLSRPGSSLPGLPNHASR